MDADGRVIERGYANVYAAQVAAERMRNTQNYYSNHFPNTPNYVAHARLNERTDAAGKPGLFLEEIQSDRHQAGRDAGYKEEAVVTRTNGQIVARFDNAKQAKQFVEQQGATDLEVKTNTAGVPDAPFRKDWPIQMFKRALADAVENGKEWIGWTTGETQAARYDLSKQISEVAYNNDSKSLFAYDKKGENVLFENSVSEEKIADYIGKEAAQRLLNAPKEKSQGGVMQRLKGEELKVGGEGMKGFYDQILPKEISKYVKQWGGQVEKSRIGQPKKHSGKLTRDELAEAKRDAKALINGDIDVAEFNDNWGTRLTDDDVPGNDPYRLNEAATDLVSVVRKERELDAGGTFEAWRVNITPQMREGIKKAGQALFVGGAAAVVAEEEL
jgi:hypothetical protein